MFSRWLKVTPGEYIHAAKYGDLDTVQRFIDENTHHPARVNFRDHSRNTALIYAAKNAHMGMIAALLRVPEIDINAQGEYGDTALIVATRESHKGIPREPLGYTKIVRTLLSIPDIDINVANHCGDTALMEAACNRRLFIVPILLARMTLQQIIQENQYQRTAEQIAEQKNCPEIATVIRARIEELRAEANPVVIPEQQQEGVPFQQEGIPGQQQEGVPFQQEGIPDQQPEGVPHAAVAGASQEARRIHDVKNPHILFSSSNNSPNQAEIEDAPDFPEPGA